MVVYESYNVRGLGNTIKWKHIRNLVVKDGVQMLCIQETKKKRELLNNYAIPIGDLMMSDGYILHLEELRGAYYVYGIHIPFL